MDKERTIETGTLSRILKAGLRLLWPYALLRAAALRPSKTSFGPRRTLLSSSWISHEDTLQRVLDDEEDLGKTYNHVQTGLAKRRAGGVNVVRFSVWIDPEDYPGSAAVRRAFSLIDALHQQISRHPELVLCDGAADCRAAAASGKIAALLGLSKVVPPSTTISL